MALEPLSFNEICRRVLEGRIATEVARGRNVSPRVTPCELPPGDPFDVKDMLCAEIDTPEDLETVSAKVTEVIERTVYMCFSTEYIHSGHMAIINKARRLGRLIVGVLSDEAVSSFKRFPLIPFAERKALFENLAGVERVVTQDTLSYAMNLRELKPDYVVHGNDWCEGFQKPIRQEVLDVLAEYGGELVEYPYSNNPIYKELDARHRSEVSMPDIRRLVPPWHLQVHILRD